MISFIGGQRSGKSALAEAWAEKLSPKRLYLALCSPDDGKMRERGGRHRARQGAGCFCIEASLEPLALLKYIYHNIETLKGLYFWNVLTCF